jgi:hypothetical protein
MRKLEWDLKRVSNNQWLKCWEQTWFDRVDTLHAMISKSEHCWWRDNNYIEKLVAKRLIQTTYNFSNILRIMKGF